MKKTKTFNVMLCGPGDVAKEIAIAREVIAEWNQQNFESLNCGLKDHHWDTDAVPSMAARGQAVINHDLIDSADLVVAIFWGRLGTPTGLHDSGTVEEITRAQSRGIPIMLYFSKIEDTRPVQDPDQRDMVQAFEAKARASGLPWTFQSRNDFRKRFADHLHKRVLEIVAQKPKTKVKKSKPSIEQNATGTGNFQVAGDGNAFHVKLSSTRPPKIVIAPSPECLTPSEQRRVAAWIEELAVLMEAVEGKTEAKSRGQLWNRLKSYCDVQKYEQIESSKLPKVEDWVRFVRREIQDKARSKMPSVFRAGKIPAIKASMQRMGRTNEDYYPEIAVRLKMRRFSSLKDLPGKDLERVYRLVLRDSKAF